MPNLSTHLTVEAPADAVWEVIGHRFERIGEWATAIPTSTAISTSTAIPASTALALSPGSTAAPPVTRLPAVATNVGAPVAGRVCTTGVRLVPQVTEMLVAYDGANRTLTYEASGLPAFVTTARNTWTVTPLDERRSRVTIQARFHTRGLLGRLGGWAIITQVGRTSRHLADDLRHYVEIGSPSPRKQRQLRRTRR